MSQTITSNTTATFGGINAGKVAHVDIRGTWQGIRAVVQTKTNGTYTNYASDAVQTANFSRYYQLGDEDGVAVVFTNNNPSTSRLDLSVIEYKP